ncbi:MAG: hypothetical protein FWG07_07785 [Treponema sp.]|nr:hypothetical protein [Treponema sp.]
MIQLIFSLRFQSQLRRTRSKLLIGLEKSIVEAIESYAGKVKIENKLIYATFNSNTIGFWLDILCLLETIKNTLDKDSSELYGHICIIGEDINELDIPLLVRTLPSNLWGTGIWCAPGINEALQSFIDFDAALSDDELTRGYSQVRVIRELGDSSEVQTREKNNSEKIRSYLKQGTSQNSIIVGDERIGKLEGLYRYCEEQMKGFPPLLVRFKTEKNSITCFTDSFSPEIREQIPEEELKNLNNTYNILFQERLRDELSEFTIKRGHYFFSRLVEAYKKAAEKKSVKPVIILENIQDADPTARLIIADIHLSSPVKERVRLYGTATKLKALETWEELFPRIVKFTPEKIKSHSKPVLPRDLWEMGYCCDLLKRYFPSFLIPQLLQEEGKNSAMIEKSMTLLSCLQSAGQIEFTDKAKEILGDEAEAVRALVQRRLLDWVKDFRLKPCFPLLSALADLGFQGDDNLILDSISADLINGTYKNIDKALEEDTFCSITGKDKAFVSIVKTQKALSCGTREDIIEAFKDALPGNLMSPVIQSRMFTNSASYYLGVCDTHSAADSVKEGMLLTQNENSGKGLARIYRLFSLVEFTNQHLSDAIDYFSFAIEHAEKEGDLTELGISSYYAAVTHFIFGNISKAKHLVLNARKAALEAILPEWADRSRFLEGRLYFETGLYQAAFDIFSELRTNYLGSGSADFIQTVDAWIFRSNIYLNNKQKSTGLKGPDAQMFIAEAALINGDYQKTLELVKKMEQTELEERFVFIEQPDWRSGFNQCELLIFSQRDLWNRMIHTFKALALCNLNTQKANSGDNDEAVREMQHIIRSDLPETDPNDAFYFYSYYRILKLAEAPDVDMNTAISIAFKRLQKRASRIDDNETKRTFLFTHYWNSSLAAAAKEHKLI